MLKKWLIRSAVLAVFVSVLAASGGRAFAEYIQAGYDLQVVKSEQGLDHGAVSYLTNPIWSVSGRDIQVNTNFGLTSFQDIRFARLYLDIWGGTKTYTCTVSATLNGTALPNIAIGGSGDSNPTFDATKTCVYGSGAGMWQVAYSGVDGLLKKDGTPNVLSFKVTDPSGNFDGRTACASLIAVYTDPSINQRLDYSLAEADGTIRKTPGTNGSPAERTLSFSGIDTTDVLAATYYAGYTHGTTGEKDQLYFNGNSLGSLANDVALGTASDYGPNNLAFDVKTYLGTNDTVLYSVKESVVGTPGEGYLRPNIGILEVAHPVPEPATMALMAAGLLGLLRRRKATT